MKKIKNKKGWIRLVEVFIAILLISGVLLITVYKDNDKEEAIFSEISQKEISILRTIELNDTLRAEILGVTSLPIEWDNFGTGLQNLKDTIEYLTPTNLECKAKICVMNDICVMENISGQNIYAKETIISANLNTYSPRQLKLFCSGGEI
jgi:hypothetical protein